MTDEVNGRQRKHRRLQLALAAAVLLILAVVFVPPLLSIGKYKARITGLISTSLGRPVRLSSVELRLLPRPGFVITNLSVADDPSYSAEPVLHADTVTASIRLLSLWRGRLAIDSISVDDASLNLVRASPGRWNLDPLFRTAAKAGSIGNAGSGAGSARGSVALPYLEATNSRINIKIGDEKLPFSLVNTDFEFWQPDPGEWRIRLRGQPARTDVSLSLEDTGEVRLEASAHRAPELREMPVHVDLDWREAQLGQLARLLIGSDPGWRGDLTGQLHLDGTADAARITTRLSATGVHRAEFAPAEPLDFDANCAFVYHYSLRALENLDCNSPLGDGRIQLTGNLTPGLTQSAQPPSLTLALDRISVGAGLDLLRTVRSGLSPDLAASGTISGRLVYSTATPAAPVPQKKSPKPDRPPGKRVHSQPAQPQGPLTGSLTLDGFALSGAGLSQPIRVPKVVLEPGDDPTAGPVVESGPEPAAVSGSAPRSVPGSVPGSARVSVPGSASGRAEALTGSMSIPAGGAAPLSIGFRLALSGYQVDLRGPASLARVRELARAAGFASPAGLDSLAGDPVTLDLSAHGPWLPPEENPVDNAALAATQAAAAPALADRGYGQRSSQSPDQSSEQVADTLTGTVSVRNANWRADFLASPLAITQATLHLGSGQLHWDPVVFTYGTVNGTASLDLPLHCPGPEPCIPRFQLQFGDLDAGRLQTAILGVRDQGPNQGSAQGSLLSDLIDRLHPGTAPPWPRLRGTVKADSLVLGPVTVLQPTATLQINPDGAEITDLDGGLLGGQLQASVSLAKPATDLDKPAYELDGSFQKLSPAAVGQLIGLRWSGGAFNAKGKIDLSGYTGKDLTDSVKGALHFEWLSGTTNGRLDAESSVSSKAKAEPVPAAPVPSVLTRFDRWTGDAQIAGGAVTLKQNEVLQGARKRAVEGSVILAEPPKVSFAQPGESQPAKH
jgi:hypothetical protein